MGDRYRLMSWVVPVVQATAGLLADRNYRALPSLPKSTDAPVASGHVTIVVPARNEAQRIAPLLRSLGALDYPDYEVLVVDDGSTDGTSDLAAPMGAQVIRVDGPPGGWTGKSHACAVGADASSGEWLLFTDADTVHGARSLRAALALAAQRQAGLVSLLPRQRCVTFWERLLLPYAYALYFVGAVNVNRPGGPAVANGQYMLFRRDAYERIEGHGAVRGSVIEDVALARHAVRLGVRVVLARAEEHLEVRMYGGLAAIWEGFGKNALRFVAVSPRTGIPTVLATVAFGAALPGALRRQAPGRIASLLVPTAALLPWARRFGVPVWYALLYPLAAAVFQVLALDSIRRSVTREGTVWKGRRY